MPSNWRPLARVCRSGYRELLGHSHASSVRRSHSSEDTYLELLLIEGALGSGEGGRQRAEEGPGQGGVGVGGPQGQLWCWVLKLQRTAGAAEGQQPAGFVAGPGAAVEDCWAIDSVVRVQGEAL